MMKILIAVDQSKCSQLALDVVLSRSWPKGSAFKLVHVFEPFEPMHRDTSETAALWTSMLADERNLRRARAEEMLQTAVSRVSRVLAGSEVTSHLAEGDTPDHAIVDLAGEWKADLVVLGSHSRRGLNRLLLGSVSHSVLLNAPCSVEIVKGGKETELPSTYNVLVCLDDSPFSEAAFQAVLHRPWTSNTTFKLISVMPPILDTSIGVESSVSVLGIISDADEAKAKARTALANKADELGAKTGSEVQTAILEGDPRHSILDVTEEWPAQLVVVGSHGRTGLSRLLLGSVSQAVSLHAPCSVEVVKLPDSQRSAGTTASVAAKKTST
jgi:nucleotide-binding universal stress UspA family protein